MLGDQCAGRPDIASKASLHCLKYHNAIKGTLLPRFARMPLIEQMIVGTLNHRVPGSSPGAPTKSSRHLAKSE
jgi:hypothetical protein